MRQSASLAYLFERAPFKTAVDRIESAIRTKTGFSLVRLGNSEGVVMGWPDLLSPEDFTWLTWAYNVAFGRSDFSDRDLGEIAEGVRQATRSADVLGPPTRFQLTRNPGYVVAVEAIDRYGLYAPHQTLTDSNAHWYLQWSGALAHLLRGLDAVHVIGCRALGPQIAAAFGVKSVQTYLVRGERAFPGSEARPHWREGFCDVMRRLETVRPGDVFLVGAGFLGKIYCDRIKKGGGIALDIGSLLDSWAHIPSRDRYEGGTPAFTLDHFKSVGDDWASMFAALDRCCKALHARDTTVTY